MKKLFLILVLGTILIAGTAFAEYPGGLGIGVQGGGGGGWEGGGFGVYRGAALSLKIPGVDIFWAIDLEASNNWFHLGVSGDKYLMHSALVPSIGLDWYLGLGVGVGVATWTGGGNSDLGLSVVGRLPLGLSWQPIDLLEIYLQIVPSLGVQISPDFYFPAGGWPINIGIRLWF